MCLYFPLFAVATKKLENKVFHHLFQHSSGPDPKAMAVNGSTLLTTAFSPGFLMNL